MKVLLDTDVIIQCLRGVKRESERIKQMLKNSDEIFFTPISSAEIYAGIKRGEEKIVAEFFDILRPIEIGCVTGEKAGEYLRTYRKSHSLEIADALIAAAAFITRVKLYTLNKKHYPMRDISFS
jgi:predicted nucleic acid-binding protein